MWLNIARLKALTNCSHLLRTWNKPPPMYLNVPLYCTVSYYVCFTCFEFNTYFSSGWGSENWRSRGIWHPDLAFTAITWKKICFLPSRVTPTVGVSSKFQNEIPKFSQHPKMIRLEALKVCKAQISEPLLNYNETYSP